MWVAMISVKPGSPGSELHPFATARSRHIEPRMPERRPECDVNQLGTEVAPRPASHAPGEICSRAVGTSLVMPMLSPSPFAMAQLLSQVLVSGHAGCETQMSVHRRGISDTVISKFTFCVSSVLGKFGRNKWFPLSPKESWMLDTTKFNATQRGSAQMSSWPPRLPSCPPTKVGK